MVSYFDQSAVILVYGQYDLWETRLDVRSFQNGLPSFEKLAGGGTRIDNLTIHSQSAAWISGGSHIVRFTDAQGREAAGSLRTVARNTLIWRTDFALYRLETELSEADAVRVAESLP